MGDSQLFPPTSGTLTPGIPTPSGLTPNTRSEAEAAFTLNSLTQTESAAPTTPLPIRGNGAMSSSDPEPTYTNNDDGTATEAQKAYRRPQGPVRTSSANYHDALMKARQESVSSNLSTTSDSTNPGGVENENVTGGAQVSSPVSATMGSVPFPPPGQGVIPLHTGIGAGQTEALKRVRPDGLSLAALGRQQSWSEQDMKHIYSGKLMVPPENDAGYSSGTESRAV